MDYLLGNNPLGRSYMVGFGPKFPRKIHHRGATIPSIDKHPQKIGCRDGDQYLYSQNPDMNQLTGAIIGGPAGDDSFSDSRMNVGQTEPTTYINAPFVGVLAYFKATAQKIRHLTFDQIHWLFMLNLCYRNAWFTLKRFRLRVIICFWQNFLNNWIKMLVF